MPCPRRGRRPGRNSRLAGLLACRARTRLASRSGADAHWLTRRPGPAPQGGNCQDLSLSLRTGGVALPGRSAAEAPLPPGAWSSGGDPRAASCRRVARAWYSRCVSSRNSPAMRATGQPGRAFEGEVVLLRVVHHLQGAAQTGAAAGSRARLLSVWNRVFSRSTCCATRRVERVVAARHPAGDVDHPGEVRPHAADHVVPVPPGVALQGEPAVVGAGPDDELGAGAGPGRPSYPASRCRSRSACPPGRSRPRRRAGCAPARRRRRARSRSGRACRNGRPGGRCGRSGRRCCIQRPSRRSPSPATI